MGEIRREIDLTSDNYWRINFEEAEIIEFDYSSKPFDNVEFEIWGARLLVDDFWDHDKSFLQYRIWMTIMLQEKARSESGKYQGLIRRFHHM